MPIISSIAAEIEFKGKKYYIEGEGNGVVSAFCHAIETKSQSWSTLCVL